MKMVNIVKGANEGYDRVPRFQFVLCGCWPIIADILSGCCGVFGVVFLILVVLSI